MALGNRDQHWCSVFINLNCLVSLLQYLMIALLFSHKRENPFKKYSCKYPKKFQTMHIHSASLDVPCVKI